MKAPDQLWQQYFIDGVPAKDSVRQRGGRAAARRFSRQGVNPISIPGMVAAAVQSPALLVQQWPPL
jgi:hypothetical protein